MWFRVQGYACQCLTNKSIACAFLQEVQIVRYCYYCVISREKKATKEKITLKSQDLEDRDEGQNSPNLTMIYPSFWVVWTYPFLSKSCSQDSSTWLILLRIFQLDWACCMLSSTQIKTSQISPWHCQVVYQQECLLNIFETTFDKRVLLFLPW